jgi:hypothetical protein
MNTHDRVRSHERHHRDRQIQDTVHDPYQERYKPASPAVCPGCSAVFEHGRWQWLAAPAGATEHLCPACRRVKESFPAGYVTLSGRFLAEHRDELMHLVRNEEARAKQEHPLARIMQIAPQGDETLVTTTDVHLAQRIGEALRHAYQGDLDIQYAKDDYQVRVRWQR